VHLLARYKVQCIIGHLPTMLITPLTRGLLFPALVIVASEAASLNNPRRYLLAFLLVYLPPEPHTLAVLGTVVLISMIPRLRMLSADFKPCVLSLAQHLIHTQFMPIYSFTLCTRMRPSKAVTSRKWISIKLLLLEAEKCAGNSKSKTRLTF